MDVFTIALFAGCLPLALLYIWVGKLNKQLQLKVNAKRVLRRPQENDTNMIHQNVRPQKVGPRSRNQSTETTIGKHLRLPIPPAFEAYLGQRVFFQVVQPKTGRKGGSFIISTTPLGALRQGARYRSSRVRRLIGPKQIHRTRTWKHRHE